MDEEFIVQVTEEELAQFPEEEGNQTNQEQNIQGSEVRKEAPQERIEGQNKENSTVNIPSLLDLKLPRLYAASRHGRWNKGSRCTAGKKKMQKVEKKETIQPQTQR